MTQRLHASARGGFTLVELIITASIIALLGTVLAGSLHGGLRIWEALHGLNDDVTAAVMGSEIWVRDVRNAVDMQSVEARGEVHELVLGALVPDFKEGGRLRPGVVGYTFDPGRHMLLRRTWRVAETDPGAGTGETILGGLAEGRFEYRIRGVNDELSDWQQEFTSRDGRLAGVRFTARFNNEAASPYSRTAWRPEVVVPVPR